MALDPLGAGDSSTSQLDRLSVDSVAVANDYAVRQIVDRIK
jgi:EAL domain-containing protein (putative c-di-GMP-specific phosphodiesterase class I)